MEKQEQRIKDIASKITLTLINLGMAFFVGITGSFLMPQIPEGGQFIYALSIMLGTVYFTTEVIMVWVDN